MNVLIIKLGATGDVVRTTPLLRKFNGSVSWITSDKNAVLLRGIDTNVRCLSWEQRDQALDKNYDLVINLEDDVETALFIKSVQYGRLFGAYVDGANRMAYSEDSRRWFDLSLISRFGRSEADRLKLLNRRTYQDLIFDGLGSCFQGENYFLPDPNQTRLTGDVAIAAESGPVWPMKKWAFYADLKQKLEAEGLTVNLLPKRTSLLQHLCDVRNHRCLIGGDSLPMHLALGIGIRCVSIFTCTSPWEIYDYGIQTKIISPLLEKFFYKRDFEVAATTSVNVEQVFDAVIGQLNIESLPRGVYRKPSELMATFRPVITQ